MINNPFRNQDLTDNSFFKKQIFQYFSSETSTKIKLFFYIIIIIINIQRTDKVQRSLGFLPRVVIKLFWTAFESNWIAIMLLFFNLWKKETYREQNKVFKWRFSKIGSIKYLWVSLGRLIKLYRPYSMINII